MPVYASTIILSTTGGATLGGLTFQDEDLVEYNLLTDTATLFFDGTTLLGSSADIDAVFIRSNGNIVLSTSSTATLGGLTFGDEDLAEYNPATDTATLFFDGIALFGGSEDIDAVHLVADVAGVPEPSTLAMLALGLVGLGYARK